MLEKIDAYFKTTLGYFLLPGSFWGRLQSLSLALDCVKHRRPDLTMSDFD